MLNARLRNFHKRATTWHSLLPDEASVVCFFPYRQPRARRSPGVENFGIRTRMIPNPFQQVKDQRLDRV